MPPEAGDEAEFLWPRGGRRDILTRMPESETIPNEPGWHAFTCPGCGEAVDVSDDAIQKLVICPYCNTQFSPQEVDTEAVDDLLRQHEEERRQTELNSLRIRAVSGERRAILRLRSYWTVLMLALCFISIELIMVAATSYKDHAPIRAVAYVLAAVGCVSATRWPFQKRQRLNLELEKPMLGEPAGPPDFSTLNDGSQRWKNLERLHTPES
jgi:hypothetical protein